MAEVGQAWVSIVPSSRGFGRQMEAQIGPQVDQSGKGIGSRLMGGMGKTLKVGAFAAGGAIAGILGTSLVKGFQRLQGIDQAEAKLRGLGHSAKSVDTIMDNALASVKGTAFGLDAAATSAAGAVAAGVKPGKDLERTLKLVGDAATIAGTDMGSMGAIFNKVAASDMIQGDVLAQLGDAGIPILQMLGKEMGVSATEVRKMASEGKINFATFQNAMESGLGGAAQESGKTFSGALANMNAALGRLGANLLGGVFSQMPALFGRATAALDRLGPVATQVGAALGSGLAALGPLLMRASEGIGNFIAGISFDFSAIQEAITPVMLTVGDLVVNTLLPTLMTLGTYLSGQLVPLISDVAGVFVNSLLPVITQVGTFVYGTLYPILLNLGIAIAQNLRPVLEALVASLRANVLPSVTLVVAKFQEWWPTISRVLVVIAKLVGGVLKLASAILGKVLPPLIKFQGFLLKNMVKAATAVVGAIVGIIGKVIEFGSAIGDGGRKVAAFARKVNERIEKVLTWFTELPGEITTALGELGTLLLAAGKSVVQGFIDGLKSKWEEGKDFVKGIGGWIKDNKGPISKDRKLLIPAGVAIMAGFGKGLRDRFKKIQADVKKIAPSLMKALKQGMKRVQKDANKLSLKVDLFKSIRDQVRSAFSPDLFSGTLSEFLSGLSTQVASNRAVQSALPRLQKIFGKNSAFLRSLMSSGNSQLILGLAGADASTLKGIQRDWNAMNSTAGALGVSVAQHDIGRGLESMTDELKRLNKAVRRLDKAIGKEVSKGINRGSRKGKKNRKKGK